MREPTPSMETQPAEHDPSRESREKARALWSENIDLLNKIVPFDEQPDTPEIEALRYTRLKMAGYLDEL